MRFFQKYSIWFLHHVRIAFVGLLAGVGLTGGYLYTLQYKGNLHAVVAGEVYRSNQPDPARIAAMKADFGIRTILNLRGAEPGAAWYDAEVASAGALGIRHIDFGMSSVRSLTPEQARRLIALMRDAPKPLLIHCKAGADRTGLAAALYVAAIAGGSKSQAQRQLSLAYGHFGFPFSPTYPMDKTFQAMEEELGFSPPPRTAERHDGTADAPA